MNLSPDTPASAPNALPRFLKEAEAAALLGVSPKTLAQWRWRGLPPRFRKFHGAIRYSVEDLLEFAGEGGQ